MAPKLNHARFLGLTILLVLGIILILNLEFHCGDFLRTDNPLTGKVRVYKYAPKGSKDQPRKQVLGPVKWTSLPTRVKNDILMNGSMAYNEFYSDEDVGVANYVPTWRRAELDKMIEAAEAAFKIQLREGNISTTIAQTIRPGYYPCLVVNLAAAMVKFKQHIQDKRVLVLNSLNLWTEAMLLAAGAKHVTASDTRPSTDLTQHARFKYVPYYQLEGKFDAIFKFDDDIDAFMHYGLGRYGDPISPEGDFERMRNIGGLLRDTGVFFHSLAVGPDVIEFNAHRVYGPKRLAKMHKGWKVQGAYPCMEQYPTLDQAFKADLRGKWENQWLFITSKVNSDNFWYTIKEVCSSWGLKSALIVVLVLVYLAGVFSKFVMQNKPKRLITEV